MEFTQLPSTTEQKAKRFQALMTRIIDIDCFEEPSQEITVELAELEAELARR